MRFPHLVHRCCLLCVVMAAIPMLHFLEPYLGLPHGLEGQLEQWVAALVPATNE